MKTKIIAVAFVLAGAASPALASDATVEQFYANSGQPYTYFGMAPSVLSTGAQDAFAQATVGISNGRPQFETLRIGEPISVQMQRWYDRHSDVY